MKRSPFIAIVLGLVLACFIYISSTSPRTTSTKAPLSVNEQIQEALSNIQNADNAQLQMKGILQMRSLSEKYPDNADLQWKMGMFSTQSGQYEKAIYRFENVIRLDGDWFGAYMQTAVCYLALKDTLAARISLNTLIEKSEGEIQNRAKLMLEKIK
jgi:Flp pilus assembly protein TadD